MDYNVALAVTPADRHKILVLATAFFFLRSNSTTSGTGTMRSQCIKFANTARKYLLLPVPRYTGQVPAVDWVPAVNYEISYYCDLPLYPSRRSSFRYLLQNAVPVLRYRIFYCCAHLVWVPRYLKVYYYLRIRAVWCTHGIGESV